MQRKTWAVEELESLPAPRLARVAYSDCTCQSMGVARGRREEGVVLDERIEVKAAPGSETRAKWYKVMEQKCRKGTRWCEMILRRRMVCCSPNGKEGTRMVREDDSEDEEDVDEDDEGYLKWQGRWVIRLQTRSVVDDVPRGRLD